MPTQKKNDARRINKTLSASFFFCVVLYVRCYCVARLVWQSWRTAPTGITGFPFKFQRYIDA